jgi:uncharacterized membrane protein YphA (DoxX/SURF4 family)
MTQLPHHVNPILSPLPDFISKAIAQVTGLLFLVSGFTKLLALDRFAAVIASYGIVATDLCTAVAAVVISAEILLGFLVMFGRLERAASIGLLFLLLLFSALSIWARTQGVSGDCGCFGDVLPRANDNWLLLENGILALMLFFSVLSKRKSNSQKTRHHPSGGSPSRGSPSSFALTRET